MKRAGIAKEEGREEAAVQILAIIKREQDRSFLAKTELHVRQDKDTSTHLSAGGGAEQLGGGARYTGKRSRGNMV